MKVYLLAILPVILLTALLSDSPSKQVNSTMDGPEIITDGPYVLYRNGHVVANYVVRQEDTLAVKVDSVPESNRSTLRLKIPTDNQNNVLSFTLKDKLQNEKAEYKKVDKMFVVSDIEGSFSAFRKLLQANKIIDEAFNWTFGTGHLVLTGDFVDRGEQVTEVLWLVYHLEEKAKQAGGYVHFILGNHEIMNMSGDLRYLNQKYAGNALLLQKNFVDLYGENSELGRWLRTKNIAEKVGNVLFVHGGISDFVNRMRIEVPEMNKIVRPHYADSTYSFKDARLDTLYSDFGPFWYRGYYTGSMRATVEQVDYTLDKFRVRHIATGHTVVADTVSVLFDGKVFNTDVPHAKGISEGLYIDGKNYYRANAMGEKFLILSR